MAIDFISFQVLLQLLLLKIYIHLIENDLWWFIWIINLIRVERQGGERWSTHLGVSARVFPNTAIMEDSKWSREKLPRMQVGHGWKQSGWRGKPVSAWKFNTSWAGESTAAATGHGPLTAASSASSMDSHQGLSRELLARPLALDWGCITGLHPASWTEQLLVSLALFMQMATAKLCRL
jgi:hypothetical protein